MFVSIPSRVSRILLIFSIFLLLENPITAQRDPELEKSRSKAFRLVDEQKFVEALPILERLSDDLPEDARVFFHLGFAFTAKANTISDAEEKKALRVRARKAFVRAKELGIREPVIDSLIQSMPADGAMSETPHSANKDADRLLKEGESYFSQGKNDDALNSYEKALKLDPNLYEAALFAGDVYVTKNNFSKAEQMYQRAISINPNRETAYRYSATPLMKQEKFGEAKERYIEAYITEPYNRYSSSGLTRWAETTGTPVGHPKVDIPDKVQIDSDGKVTLELPAETLLGGKDNGTFFWTLYGPARTKWRKEGFAKAFPNESQYRHSLAEEVDAIRTVLSAVKRDRSIKKLDTSLEKLIKLDDQALLESFLLLSHPVGEVPRDHPAYLKQNRDKLRRYVKEYMIDVPDYRGPAGSAGQGKADRPSVVESSYDGTTKKTTVKIALAPITCVRPGACIFYSIETSYDGQKVPDKLGPTTLVLVVMTKSLTAESNPQLAARVDGKILDLGQMQLGGEESTDGLRAIIYAVEVKEETIAAITSGKRVELKLGSLQFPLVDPNLRELGEWYRTAKGLK